MRGIIKWIFMATLMVAMTACQSEDSTQAESVSTTTETTVSTMPATTEPVTPVVELPSPAFGGTLRIAMSPADTLDPYNNQIQNVGQVLNLIYEPLFTLDATLKPVPVLVDTYSFSQEGKALSITLKPNVLFHNGEVLTTADVVYSIDLAKEIESSPYNPLVLAINRMTVQDDLSMTLYFEDGYAFTLNDLVLPVVPKGYHRSKDYDPMIPVGSGPYQFKEYQAMQKLELSAFTEWHGGDVYIENITAIAMNETSDLEPLFDQHLIDLMNPTKFNWIKYSEKEDQRIETYISNNYTFLGFNMLNSAFQDVKVRQAFGYAIDREALLYNLFINHGAVSDTPVIPGSWFDDGKAPVYSYDLEMAKNLLDTKVFKDMDGDGFFDRVDPVDPTKSTPLLLDLLVNSDSSVRLKVADVLIKDIEALGFQVSLTEATGQAYYDKITAGDYDLLLGGWQLSSKPDYMTVFGTGGLQNITGYSSEKMDLAMDAIIRSYDETSVKNRVADFESLFIEEMPYVSLYFLEGAVMVHDNVYGELTPTIEGTLNNTSAVYVDLTNK